MLSQNDQERYSVYVVAKVLNVFYIGKGLGEFLRTRHAVSLRGWSCPCIRGCVFWGRLLYFRGGCGGRVKVACTLLYSIFRVGRGLLYFRGCFWGEILDEKNPFLDGGRNGFFVLFLVGRGRCCCRKFRIDQTALLFWESSYLVGRFGNMIDVRVRGRRR